MHAVSHYTGHHANLTNLADDNAQCYRQTDRQTDDNPPH